jgi:S1-C subfamily serine protease
MSHGERRIHRVAVGFAAIALVVAGATVVVTWRSGRSERGAPAPRHVAASDVVRLRPGALAQVDTGVRVVDAALRRSLGLVLDDTITAISGRPIARASELVTALRDLAIYRPRSLFLDVVRDRDPVLVRWELDGDLDIAWRAELAAAGPGGPVDPRIASVRQLSTTTYEVSRAVVEAWTADPDLVTSGGRGVPVAQPGAQGIRLYAIRTGSAYAALGLQNGDVIRAINGIEIASGRQILDLVARSTAQISVEVLRQGQPMTLNYLIK